MNVLGFYEGINPSAGLSGATPLVFIEQERLSRTKHAPGEFPIRSIVACLTESGIDINGLDAIVYPWDGPSYTDGRLAAFYARTNERFGVDTGTLRWQQRNLAWYAPAAVRERLDYELRRETGTCVPPDLELTFIPHHEAHAYTAVAGRPTTPMTVIVLDGSGEDTCTSVWSWDGEHLTRVWRQQIPHSLGWFYAAITEFVGFDAYDGEYKLMGLAGLGEASAKMTDALAEVLRPSEDGVGYRLDRTYIHDGPHTHSHRFSDRLVDLLGVPPRPRQGELTDVYLDIAASAQNALENVVSGICAHFVGALGCRHIAMSGGVAMNVKMNGALLRQDRIDDVWVPPYPNDSGTPLGAIASHLARRGHPMPALDQVHLGPDHPDPELLRHLRAAGVPFTRPRDLARRVAAELAAGRIVAWFQGRSEAGQRALGHRSILGDPRSAAVARRINDIVKQREPWRPLCPVLQDRSAHRYITDTRVSPHMMIAVPATERARRELAPVVHADGSMRPQLLRRHDNPRLWDAVSAFHGLTGTAALINTSLNRAGQPMAETPRDALELFGSTPIDVLVMGPYLAEKPPISAGNLPNAQ